MKSKSSLIVICLILFWPALLWAQDPEGQLDYFYIVCGGQGYVGSGQNEVCFQLRFHIDNIIDLNGIATFLAPIIITGNNIVSVDTALEKAYEGSDLEPGNWGIRIITKEESNPDPTVPPFWMIYGAVSFETTLTGDGKFVNICLTINDTGTICLDTLSNQIVNPQFAMGSGFAYTPGWGGTTGLGYPDGQGICCQLPLCQAIPGDASADGNHTLTDIIDVVNYVFNKPGCSPAPQCWLSSLHCRGDWNGDGKVGLADVVYGVNYIFNRPGGPWTPKPSGSCCQPVP